VSAPSPPLACGSRPRRPGTILQPHLSPQFLTGDGGVTSGRPAPRPPPGHTDRGRRRLGIADLMACLSGQAVLAPIGHHRHRLLWGAGPRDSVGSRAPLGAGGASRAPEALGPAGLRLLCGSWSARRFRPTFFFFLRGRTARIGSCTRTGPGCKRSPVEKTQLAGSPFNLDQSCASSTGQAAEPAPSSPYGRQPTTESSDIGVGCEPIHVDRYGVARRSDGPEQHAGRCSSCTATSGLVRQVAVRSTGPWRQSVQCPGAAPSEARNDRRLAGVPGWPGRSATRPRSRAMPSLDAERSDTLRSLDLRCVAAGPSGAHASRSARRPLHGGPSAWTLGLPISKAPAA
jgi:hypothetical protein